MVADPIVDEVRAVRQQIFAECGYDLATFNARMRELADTLARQGWPVADRPIVKRETSSSYGKEAPETSVVREEPPSEN